MIVAASANDTLASSTLGGMFNSSTPPSRRIRGGAGGDNRKKPTLPVSSELPYISPISNHSYGSKATNVPKPPRLSDTRVRLADAIQAKKDEIEARIRVEQVELEKLAARRSESMPPPSPTKSQGTVRTSREQTDASTSATSGRISFRRCAIGRFMS